MGVAEPSLALSGWSPKEIKKHKVSVYKLSDGTFEAFASNQDVPSGAECLSPQPKIKTSGDPREGTRVALKKLESQYPDHIRWGCYVAVKWAKRRLTVHSRTVRDEMERLGLLKTNEPEFWLGAVFNKLKREGIIATTGQSFTYSDAERGIHERTIKVWGLVENCNTSAYDTEPPPMGSTPTAAPAKRGKK